MRDLNHDFKELCRHNRDGSYATQADRAHILDLVANQLHEMGVRGLRAQGFKPRHVQLLVARWLAEQLAPGTIKNRMSQLRWLAQKIGKDNIVERTNAAYGIPDRVYVTNISKAKALGREQLESIRTPCARMSLRLQAAFGLRREASIKIVPAWADRGDTLVLKASWNKGGREIRIPIRTPEQRQLLDEAKALAKGKSLVAPGYATYRDYLQHFRYECGRVGIHAFHGHRHLYAQARYQEMTGWACPARGGPTSRQLTPAAEGDRSRSARDHQPRDGPRPRADHRGLLGSIGFRSQHTPHGVVHEHARSASRRRLPAHPSGDPAGEGSRRGDSRREDRQVLGIRRR